jgi:predicted nucleic acid-binding protein
MKILLDTNIVIHRETSRIVNPGIGKLFYWFDKLNYRKSIHPLTVQEIQRHRDPDVVKTMSVKLDNYYVLKTEAPITEAIKEISAKLDKTENDFNDTRLLNELVVGRVDLLITEDKNIHRKGRQVGTSISEKIYTIERFLEKMNSENPDFISYKVLAVKKEYFGNIKLEDPFFDSFRKDYEGFDHWFQKKSDEIAYICYEDEQVMAFLFLKVEDADENYQNISPKFEKKRRLKIGTFKVTLNGFKLGERFLKIIFDNAFSQKVDEIYVTIFDKTKEQSRLIELLQEWGFILWGQKTSGSGTEHIFVKNFQKVFNPVSPKLTYPFVSLNTDCYLVPIYGAYHTELLPDSILNTESKLDFVENEPHRNSISKVYISRSLNKSMKPGDTIIFYRTGDTSPKYYSSVITTIGIIDSIVRDISDEDRFIELCRRRSVFSDDELRKHWNHNPRNRPFIVNFLYTYSFPSRINLKTLIELGVIANTQSAPQGFEKISREKFQAILTSTKTDESIIVN